MLHHTSTRWRRWAGTGRRRATLAGAGAAGVALVAGALGIAGTGSASAGTVSGTLYADPNSAVLRWLAANPNDSRASMIRDRIGSQPQGKWFTSVNGNVTSDVAAYVNGANSVGQIPQLVVYAIPNRDCGGASAGGASDIASYGTWIRNLAAGLGSRTAMVLLEPDSLALQTCLSGAQVAERDNALASAVTTIKSADASAKVYLDGGHSAWNSASDQASRLVAGGVKNADGFFSNVSNFRTTSDETAYGQNVLNAIGASNLHQVIDTSRNGNGPDGSAWCDPAGRAIGRAPTTNTGVASVDAFLWVKPPGEADGCAAAAGTFSPDLAYELAKNGVAPSIPASPTPTTASPTARPTQTASPTRSPTPTTSPTPSATPTPTATAGSCAVTYHVDSQWPTGFTATVTITNRGPGIAGWTLAFAFGGDQHVTNAWNGTATQSGSSVTVKDVGWNGALATNASASFGFQATYSGTNATPTSFTVNGVRCA